MEDVSEMCHIIRTRARSAIAKVKVCFLFTQRLFINLSHFVFFLFRSENTMHHLLATATSGLMTGQLLYFENLN